MHCLRITGPNPNRTQVSLSAFAFLFSELVQYCHSKVQNVTELEQRYACTHALHSEHNQHRLEDAGYGVGLRLLELLHYREGKAKRETNLLRMLMFVHTTVWKYLFGKPAKDLQQSTNVRRLCACFSTPVTLIHSVGGRVHDQRL